MLSRTQMGSFLGKRALLVKKRTFLRRQGAKNRLPFLCKQTVNLLLHFSGTFYFPC